MEFFHTETFLEEIKKRPEIWKFGCDGYKDKMGKTKAWESVCEVFCSNFHQLEVKEKIEIAEKLQKKWKGFRDCYNRELRRRERKDGRESTGKQYVYFDQLSFLSNSYFKDTPTDDSSETRQDSVTCVPTLLRFKRVPKRKAIEMSEAEEDLELIAQSNGDIDQKSAATDLDDDFDSRSVVRAYVEEGDNQTIYASTATSQSFVSDGTVLDDDHFFCLSLVGDMRKISEEYKADAKISIIQTLQKFKRKSASS